MRDYTQFYMNGAWVASQSSERLDVVNPSNEEVCGVISLGNKDDVDKAVGYAKHALTTWRHSSVQERKELLESIIATYNKYMDKMAQAISEEMGAPQQLAANSQAPAGPWHLKGFIKALDDINFAHPFKQDDSSHYIYYEPVGVIGLITPWNWPMNQVSLKVGAAIAAGCTMVLKPSEIAPFSSYVFTEIMHEAGVPQGVYNMINGDGAGVGTLLTEHRDVAMISFTGSTRAGKLISKNGAENIKRISLELGGKSPNIIFADADLDKVIPSTVRHCFENTGQSCNAPTRMLVERACYDEVVERAHHIALQTNIGLASDDGKHIGPLSSQVQFDKVQHLIQSAIDEGARLVAGGVGRPEGFNKGYFVRPTIFADVTQDMTIWHEEVFGPVLAITPFDSDDEAIELANDTVYGLAAYVQTANKERGARMANNIEAGMVHFNGAGRAMGSPFGGFKQSGIGREGGMMGIEDFLEVKYTCGSFWT